MPKILAIDDREDSLLILKTILNDLMHDIEVISALSGREGIKKVQQETPDTILLDISMPDMDGFEVCRILKSNDSTKMIPIIMLTAMRTDSSARIKALELGADAFLSKPVDESELVAQIRAMLRIRKAEAKLRDEKKLLEELVLQRMKELQASEEKYRMLVKTSPDGIATVSLEGKLLEANRAFLDMVGYTSSELDAINFLTLVDTVDSKMLQQKIQTIDSLDNVIDLEVVLKKRNGQQMNAHLTSWAVIDEFKKPQKLGVFIKDITERKKAERELEHSKHQLMQTQKMESLGTLAGGIAHDFNNILFQILGYSQMGLKFSNNVEKVNRYFDIILAASNRATALVNQILTFSRGSSEKQSPMMIQPILKEALKLLRSSLPSTIEIQQQIKTDTGLVMGNSTQIYQLIMNLCTNAFHAMRDQSGTLHVLLQDIEINDHSYRSRHLLPVGNYIELKIKDNGCGIDPEIVDKIFDPYFTTKKREEGTGLGLSIVQGIVKGHKGIISVSSRPNIGTEFDILFPQTISTKESRKRSRDNSQPGGNETILVIDDEPDVVNMEKEYLQEAGYEVYAFTSSTEAMEFFYNHYSKIDLVVTDQTMPKLTGVEVAKQILKIKPSTPIVMLTGYSKVIDKEGAKKLGIRDYLNKPVDLVELVEVIRKILLSEKRFAPM